jgi:organic hydroperoxide reductase OsmC/OhrA
MQPFPHRYSIAAVANPAGDVSVYGANLPALATGLPAEFGGTGNQWSPETLFVAAVADCFVLTFRGIARASKLTWTSIACEVDGTLDRVERLSQFTGYVMRVMLHVPPGTSQAEAQRVLVRAEQTCLVGNSLRAAPRLEACVEVDREEEETDHHDSTHSVSV